MNHSYKRKDIYKKSGVYIIKNNINERVYVGSSVNLYKRLNAHTNNLINKKHANAAMMNFVKKHGHECLTFEVIEFCDRSVLIEKENFYINKHKAYGVGFNCSPVANAPFVGGFSEETRKKISEARKLYIKNNQEENKKRLESAHAALSELRRSGKVFKTTKGMVASEKTRLLQSLAKKGKKSHVSESGWKIIRAAHKEKCSGSKSRLAKLKEVDVINIREMLKVGAKKTDICKLFNVSVSTMYDIEKRISWNHI